MSVSELNGFSVCRIDAGRPELRGYVVDHLGEAIESGWVKVFYQPVMRTVSGKLCGMEALARWDDPVHGLLPPDVFIAALEDARLIHKLDSCMIEQVCRRLRADLDAGRPVVPVSVNLSRLDFDLCDIHDVVDRSVRANGVPRSYVNIEITESVFGNDPALMAGVIDRFHDIGYQVWMDDFGSAYSSLNVLKDFEFDELKIDMGFLSRFGEKSRTIIASVVDMAKRLGIQTLAEGVETREHAEFLRHIGCEKQQGYFYGRPEPLSEQRLDDIERTFGVERQDERRYYRTVGSVNTLSLSERDFMPDNTTKDYVTSMPLAFVEYDGEFFSVLDCNDPFAEALGAIGIPDVETGERLMNDTMRQPARTARRLMENIEAEGFARQDYVVNSRACVMRAKHVATHGRRVTVLVTLDSAASTREQDRRSRMSEALEALYSIYEHVDIMHLDEGYAEPVFSQDSFKPVYDIPDMREAVRQFAENEIYPADRERYLDFMDVGTLGARIDATGQGYLVGFFRTRDRGGDFAWKLYALIRLDGQPGNRVMICIRDTHWENDALFQSAYDRADEELPGARSDADGLAMTDGSLWRAFVKDSGVGIFWKDLDRRFVGCNQRFLDYFGFESPDAVTGKTDEDMGWHVNPVPYMSDEVRVLETGQPTFNVPGQCIARGELRDIVASKRPVYRNGRIVGLVGCFVEPDGLRSLGAGAGEVPYTDSVTGLLSYAGLDAATGRFVEAYQKLGADFAMLMFDIENFKHYNDQYGYEFGDKVLKCAADVIAGVAGADGVVGHVYADRFIVLKQEADIEHARELGAGIVEALGSISEVDGVSCTIYAHVAAVMYSEVDNVDQFKRIARARLHEAKVQPGR